MADTIVDVWTGVTLVSPGLCRTRVEDEGGKVVCDTECGARVDTIKDIGNGDGDDDKGVAASEVGFSCCVGNLVDGKVEENNC